jgi:hypothetical protein
MNRFYYPTMKIQQDHTHLNGVSIFAVFRTLKSPSAIPGSAEIATRGAPNPDTESRISPPHTALSARDAISKPRNVAPFANGDLKLRRG